MFVCMKDTPLYVFIYMYVSMKEGKNNILPYLDIYYPNINLIPHHHHHEVYFFWKIGRLWWLVTSCDPDNSRCQH